jgi:hypothetical protein
MKIQGKFLYYDVENLNGRIYTKEVSKDIIKQFEEYTVPIFGQMGYPSADKFTGDMEHTSHVVREIHINEETKSIDGTIEILDNESGRKLMNMIDNDPTRFGELFVIRSRGFGEVNENKEITNFKILSFDIVSKETDAFKIK